MDILKDIIQQCHIRHQDHDKLRQRKTVVTPDQYHIRPFHFKVHCARRTDVMLDELERADISFMPIGNAPESDHGPLNFGGERFTKRQGMSDWHNKVLNASWGIQIYTGIPSERNGAPWHDLYFTYQAICAAPDAVYNCVEALVKTTANPLLVLTKSGGLRFSFRITDYLHPIRDAAKSYIYKHTPTTDNQWHRDVYLQIRGDKGYSRWDGRYEILLGDLLDPPVITKELLFAPIDVLRAQLHVPSTETYPEIAPEITRRVPPSLGSNNLDLAKAALLKRGFSYIQKNSGFHYWICRIDDGSNILVSLWEDGGVVWVRAAKPNTEISTIATPITDIFNDTGITAPQFAMGLPVNDKILAVREGNLSPLAIKRSPHKLHFKDMPKKVYHSREEKIAKLREVFEGETRILGIVSESIPWTDPEIDAYLQNGGSICLNIADRNLVKTAEEHYRELDLPTVARWRARLYQWDQAKDIPIEERMANPFQAGNVCEDPERCHAVEQKGGDSRESICPSCPVYAECQERGYLSQPETLQRATTQITPVNQLFLDPRRASAFKRILDPANETEQLYILDQRMVEVNNLFLERRLSKGILEQWSENWHGHALGIFANALLNVLEAESEPNRSGVERVRAVVQAFQQHADALRTQMCYINVRGKAAARGIDDGTGAALAQWTIEFDGGATAYIPLNPDAEEKLKANGAPFVPLDVLERIVDNQPLVGGVSNPHNQPLVGGVSNPHNQPLVGGVSNPHNQPLVGGVSNPHNQQRDIQILMRIDEMIALGILDTETVDKIEAFPTACSSPSWTFWHELKSFFDHYKRDTDAPMRWSGTELLFWIPPMLHPSIKRLLLVLPTLPEKHLRGIFPEEKIEVVRIEPNAWKPGNQVFQIRTGIHSANTLLNFDGIWEDIGFSKTAERLFFGIRTEIARDTTVKHVIISNGSIVRQLEDLTEKENVCDVVRFKSLHGHQADLEDAQVVWLIGTPNWAQRIIWWNAQMVFGNDETPLNYDGDLATGNFVDERIQSLYQQHVAALLTQIVGQVELDRCTGKKVVLLNSMPIPDITDRQETLLFDWEDFEVAGGLDKMPEVIATRERFEAERDNLTADSSREEVERVMGCSSRHANYIRKKMRGGNIPRVSLRDQILFLLSTGEKKTAALVAAIDSSAQTIGNELKRLLDAGEIVRVQRGVYALPES